MFIQNQKVVCVNDKFPAWVYQIYKQLPLQGEVYTVRALSPMGQSMNVETGKFEEDLVIYLNEIHNPNDPNNRKHQVELGFRIERFAPLEEDITDLEIEQEKVAA